ncbi:sugar transferase [Formosa agariphila]|uniref:sugar transferase n=1 Tax=Formosa agariphila TaxID=320324 RepID=UPI0009FF453E|nr:sugar transferase [Formosa agariphila]
MRPGITGWAQVNHSFVLERKVFIYDVWYVTYLSFNNDLRILLKTLQKLFHKESITSIENASLGAWQGNT